MLFGSENPNHTKKSDKSIIHNANNYPVTP